MRLRKEQTGMYSKILIATDGSPLAGKAVFHGIALAKAVGSRVAIVSVTEMWSALEISRKAGLGEGKEAIAVFERIAAEHASRHLAAAGESAGKAGVEFETHHIADQRPSDGILQVAREAGCDLIVMATHGRRGIDRVLLGSQTNEVVTRSQIPVLVLR